MTRHSFEMQTARAATICCSTTMCDTCRVAAVGLQEGGAVTRHPAPRDWYVCDAAIEHHHLDCLRTALAALDVARLRTSHCNRLLHHAVECDSRDALEVLQLGGVAPSCHTLAWATWLNRAALVEFLLTRDVAVRVPRSIIEEAAVVGALDCLVRFDAHGVIDPDTRWAIKTKSVAHGHAHILRWVHERYDVPLTAGDLMLANIRAAPPHTVSAPDWDAVTAYLAAHQTPTSFAQNPT